MRLIKENKLLHALPALILISVFGCHYIGERQMIIGRWQYKQVLSSDTALFPLEDTDYLEFNSDSTFHYEIASVNKKSDGRWSYTGHVLALKYEQPDTTRFFTVDILSKYDLIFDEGAKHFVLKRLE